MGTIPIEEFAAFCKNVEMQAEKVAAAAGNGNSQRAMALALELVQFAMTTRHQAKMQQEVAGEYDLAALRVDHTVPSNSETGWERED